jgi:hypothetical protein
VTVKLPCDSCQRPARRLTLYARDRSGVAVLVGRFGPACFYQQAHAVAAQGLQPEHYTNKPIYLRGLR